ncbi:ABC transporter ATP-binding protein [Massilia sp. CF038]|uniref:ABC transporter ATP-binding protein n=1 Tax=Massilia sp. CF038 TaxID=1881045 RepID=UPI0009191AC2|nr:ABC transporter ATP-binding protein [Massilia sp. CF038]SHG39772.1 lipopolysaccharide transport system ATP-binding protein [Massilia sp. CF038]
MSGRIHVNGVGKAYKQYPTRWSRMAEWMLPFLGPRHSLKWVLQQIRFEVAPGEAVGLIGINGAGKSTLLKLITGTTQPSTGSVHMGGRVAAMLELGMGFHPDFTGRQNVIMAGQLLGMSVTEILALMPEIEAFAEIGDYIDQQVRVYSSGMQVRLAFSLATARRPDVLIIDEALSVGDAYFQHKSFERIRAFRTLGTTLLIVSHDRAAIQSICDRAILLNKGTVAMEGRPDEVMDYYNALLGEKDGDTVTRSAAAEGRSQTRSGTGEASVTELWLEDAQGQRVELVNVGTAVTLCARASAHADIDQLVFGYAIKDRLGQDMYGTNTFHLDAVQHQVRRGEELTFRFAFPLNLGPGSYSVTTALTSSDTHLTDNYEWRDLALLFIVVNMDRTLFVGTSWIEPTVEILR